MESRAEAGKLWFLNSKLLAPWRAKVTYGSCKDRTCRVHVTLYLILELHMSIHYSVFSQEEDENSCKPNNGTVKVTHTLAVP